LINAIHQHGVLVDLMLGNFHEALADRLDIAGSRVMPLNGRQQTERGGGFAFVLARRRDEKPGVTEFMNALQGISGQLMASIGVENTVGN
jgi:hypothetical protein